jgi:hypothetical protein
MLDKKGAVILSEAGALFAPAKSKDLRLFLVGVPAKCRVPGAPCPDFRTWETTSAHLVCEHSSQKP